MIWQTNRIDNCIRIQVLTVAHQKRAQASEIGSHVLCVKHSFRVKESWHFRIHANYKNPVFQHHPLSWQSLLFSWDDFSTVLTYTKLTKKTLYIAVVVGSQRGMKEKSGFYDKCNLIECLLVLLYIAFQSHRLRKPQLSQNVENKSEDNVI